MSWVESKSQYDKINNSLENIYEFTRRLTREIRTLRARNDENLTEEIIGLVNERNRLKNLADSSRQEMARLLYNLTPIIEQEEVKDRFDDRIKIINVGHDYDSIYDTVNIIRENRLRYGDAIIYEDMFFVVASRGSCFVFTGLNIHNIGNVKFCIVNRETYLSPMFWNSPGNIVMRETYELDEFVEMKDFEDEQYRYDLPYKHIFSTTIYRERCIIYSPVKPTQRSMIVPLHIERENREIHITSGSGNYLYDLERRRVDAFLDGIPNKPFRNTIDTDSESGSDSEGFVSDSSSIEDPMVNEMGMVRVRDEEEDEDDSGNETDSEVGSDFGDDESVESDRLEPSDSESEDSESEDSESEDSESEDSRPEHFDMDY